MDSAPAVAAAATTTTTDTPLVPTPSGDLKRKRSPSNDAHPHLPKVARTPNHLQINYLARLNEDDLALASTNDTMPEIIDLLNQYHGVLERHESLACNLGARPLGPILIKRFERLFDGPPKLLKSHGKEGANVTWLDVVEFARNKPEQFTLGQMSEGLKVCQFYTKQCRVQISEEDFVLINSGIPQKMIPPQPIVEDEEKELGTLEIFEDKLGKICHLADQVAARTRQLNHRIKGRKQAILDRRATEPSISVRPTSPSNAAVVNGNGHGGAPAGFIAVNSRSHQDSSGGEYSKTGASSATRRELLNRFTTLGDRKSGAALHDASQQRASLSGPTQGGAAAVQHAGADAELAALLLASNNASSHSQPAHSASAPLASPSVAVPTPSQYHHHTTSPSLAHAQQSPSHSAPRPPAVAEKEKPDDGPFKSEMVSRMESLGKGERVLPPCDRCRRLHMDCLKNLTACMGCTRKHAKCSWREVREDELLRTASAVRPMAVAAVAAGDAAASSAYHAAVPMDPAMHSPIFDQHYRPAMTAAASAGVGAPPTYAYHAGAAPAASGAVDGGSAVDTSLHELAGFAEAEAAFSAAKRAREGRGSISDTDAPREHRYESAFRGGPTAEEEAARDPARAAYLEQLGGLYDQQQSRLAVAAAASDGAPDHVAAATQQQQQLNQGHDASKKPEDGHAQDIDMTGVDEEHAELIQRRLARAQQASPDAEPAGGGGVHAAQHRSLNPKTQVAERMGSSHSAAGPVVGVGEGPMREHVAAA